MTFRIKRAGDEFYLASEIDPGGMSVFWVSKKNADTWATSIDAIAFKTRVAERYPNEMMVIAEEGAVRCDGCGSDRNVESSLCRDCRMILAVKREHDADRSTPSWLGRVAGLFFGRS